MFFEHYESKPMWRILTRMAFQITLDHVILKPKDIGGYNYTIGHINKSGITTKPIEFKAFEEPKVGDWIVRLTPVDTYHCTDAVFRERNIVP
jgi:hypothetical protein